MPGVAEATMNPKWHQQHKHTPSKGSDPLVPGVAEATMNLKRQTAKTNDQTINQMMTITMTTTTTTITTTATTTTTNNNRLNHPRTKI